MSNYPLLGGNTIAGPIAIKIASLTVALDRCTINPFNYKQWEKDRKVPKHMKTVKVRTLKVLNKLMFKIYGTEYRLARKCCDKLTRDINKYKDPVFEVYSLGHQKENWLFEYNKMTYNIREKIKFKQWKL